MITLTLRAALLGYAGFTDYPDPESWIEIPDPTPTPGPEIPPPVWDSRPISNAACQAATMALCG